MDKYRNEDIFSEINDIEKTLYKTKKKRKRRKKKGRKTKNLDRKISKLEKKLKRYVKAVKALRDEVKRRPNRTVWEEVIINTAPLLISRTFDLIEIREKRGGNN